MAKILIVDDDPETRETLGEMMDALGHSSRVARDGQQGLKEIELEHPDLVLLDVEMPVLGGTDMAYRMFVHNVGQEEIPIVLVSGVSELKMKAIQVGTPYFLSKPFNFQALNQMLERALRERVPPIPATAINSPRH